MADEKEKDTTVSTTPPVPPLPPAPPAPEVNADALEKANKKLAEGKGLNHTEAAALQAHHAAETQLRGYREIEWHGQRGIQSIITGDTFFGEAAEFELNQHHMQLPTMGVADPRASQ